MFTALKVLWEEKGELWEEISLHKVLERMGRADLKSLVYPLILEAAVGALLDEAVLRVKELSALRKLSDAAFKLLHRIKDESEIWKVLLCASL